MSRNSTKLKRAAVACSRLMKCPKCGLQASFDQEGKFYSCAAECRLHFVVYSETGGLLREPPPREKPALVN